MTLSAFGFEAIHHTGQCKLTGCCYNELVVAFFRTGDGFKGKKGRIAFAHFLQLAMISFAHILRFHLRTIFTPPIRGN